MRIRIPLFSSLVLFSLTAAGTAGAAPATILPGFTSPATLEFANAANTVPLFDDFDGTDFDASIWDARVEDAEATVTVADGVVTVVDPIDPVDARQGALRMFSELSFDAPSFSMSLDVTAHSGDFTSSLGSERVSGDDDNSNASLEANVSVNTDGFGPQVHLRVSYREGYYDEVLDEFVEVVDESESLQLPAPPSTPYTVTLTYDAVTETGTATLDAADGSFEISLTNVPAMAAYRARVDVGSHDSGGGTVEFTRFHASNLFLPARYTASAAPLTAQGTDYSFIDFDGEPLGPGDLFLGDDFTSVFADDTPVGIDGGDDINVALATMEVGPDTFVHVALYTAMDEQGVSDLLAGSGAITYTLDCFGHAFSSNGVGADYGTFTGLECPLIGDPDGCPDDPDKTEPGICGCGIPDTDSDANGVADCNEGGETPEEVVGDALGALADVVNDPATPVEAVEHLEKVVSKLGKVLNKLDLGEDAKALKKLGKAVRQLMKAQDDGADVQSFIDTFVDLAQGMAEEALADAIAAGGDAELIAKAETQMSKAQDDLDAGEYDKAVKHFKKALNKSNRSW